LGRVDNCVVLGCNQHKRNWRMILDVTPYSMLPLNICYKWAWLMWPRCLCQILAIVVINIGLEIIWVKGQDSPILYKSLTLQQLVMSWQWESNREQIRFYKIIFILEVSRCLIKQRFFCNLWTCKKLDMMITSPWWGVIGTSPSPSIAWVIFLPKITTWIGSMGL